jgi:hypothetical protein
MQISNMKGVMMKQQTRLNIETLEDRITPSTWGIAWPYANLRASFAPDGTLVDGNQSSLFNTLGAQAATRAWEAEVLRALQTWADAANLNVGLVADGGQPIGCPGLIQGDPRFGDIRFAAEPMGLGAPLAIGSPYNPIAGTRSGSVIFNSSYSFNIGGTGGSYDIYTVALHELGHSFGIGDSTDPTTIMYNTYQGVSTGLTPKDVAAVQALYGPRTPDAYEGPAGNNSLSTAATMALPEIAADIGVIGQTDYYQYTIPKYADQTVLVSAQNGGVSLVQPRLSIYSASGALLGTSAAANPFSANVSISLSHVKRGTVLYFKVDSASGNVFGMGGYRLKVDSGGVSQKQIAAIEAALNGMSITYINFGHSTSTISTAVSLDRPVFQIDPRFNYAVDARLGDVSDVDFFSITVPATAPQALIFTTAPGQNSILSPVAMVYDAIGNVVNAEVLSNETSGYVVQVLNPVAGAQYFVAVSANPFAASINDKGTYRLGVNYSNTPIILETLDQGTLSATDTMNVISLQSTEVQLYHFVFSVNTGGLVPGVQVVMQLFDANNNLVLSLLCQDGNTVSADVQLNAGTYTAQFIGSSTTGAPIPVTNYLLLGMDMSNPLDPVSVNPTTTSTPTTNTPSPSPTSPPSTPTTSSTLVVNTPTTSPTQPPPPSLPNGAATPTTTPSASSSTASTAPTPPPTTTTASTAPTPTPTSTAPTPTSSSPPASTPTTTASSSPPSSTPPSTTTASTSPPAGTTPPSVPTTTASTSPPPGTTPPSTTPKST